MESEVQTDRFILARKRKIYDPVAQYPTINVGRATYEVLANAAADSGLPLSEVARQAIKFAFDHLEWIEQE